MLNAWLSVVIVKHHLKVSRGEPAVPEENPHGVARGAERIKIRDICDMESRTVTARVLSAFECSA